MVQKVVHLLGCTSPKHWLCNNGRTAHHRHQKMTLINNANGQSHSSNISMKNKKSVGGRRRTIKLTFIGAMLLAMYILFIYIILISFETRKSANANEDEGSKSSLSAPYSITVVDQQPLSGSLRRKEADGDSAAGAAESKGADEEVGAKKEEPTIADFCGMCQWHDMGFNCNERVE